MTELLPHIWTSGMWGWLLTLGFAGWMVGGVLILVRLVARAVVWLLATDTFPPDLPED